METQGSKSASKKKRKKKGASGITDAEILALIESGEVVVDIKTADVVRKGVIKTATIIGRDGDNGSRYRLEFWIGHRRRTISRSKLVYMAATRKPVPHGFQIHHIDGDRYNDAYHNLIAVSLEDHLKLHGLFKYDFDDLTDEYSDVPF